MLNVTALFFDRRDSYFSCHLISFRLRLFLAGPSARDVSDSTVSCFSMSGHGGLRRGSEQRGNTEERGQFQAKEAWIY